MSANRNGAYREGDTIAAEATPPGRGGISVIRVSGPRAREIVGMYFDRILPAGGKFKYGYLKSPPGSTVTIDEAVVTCFTAPHSYTGELVVEVSTHGSPVVVAEVLELFYRAGARPAEPGEFTYHAFLNDRLDLTQAEAVADLIDAQSRRAAQRAVAQLKGGIGEQAQRVSDLIVKALVLCELELDFVEEDVELASTEEKLALVDDAIDDLNRMLAGYDTSRSLREGVKVAIQGAPNVGKSSLFNALIGSERAIVHERPGTTRDVLQASAVIEGVAFDLFDTAGIRESPDAIEDEGIRRAIKAAEEADLTVKVFAVEVNESDAAEDWEDSVIPVLNKIDLGAHTIPPGVIGISVKEDANLQALRDALYHRSSAGDAPSESTISRERHYIAVKDANEALTRAKLCLEERRETELVAEELRDALGAMDTLTGKKRLKNILTEIFRDFCIGK